MLEKILPFFRKPGIITPVMKFGKTMSNILDLNHYRLQVLWEQNKTKYYARERRIQDAISLNHEPDRVPVIGNGINFFTAKYAGITCEQYMFDWAKLEAASIKCIQDFDLDMYFMNFMFNIGRMVEIAEFDLLKLPGRAVDENSSYQYNERDRMSPEEYELFLKEGMPFLINTMAPRCAGIFKKKGIARSTAETRLLLEFSKFAGHTVKYLNEMRAYGAYCIFGTAAFPPFDIISFAFRTISSLARDMIKKDYREKIAELCKRINPWLIALYKTVPLISGLPGVWFTVERAFSLSPKQFEALYWPTYKQMIIALVDAGLVPFLTMESDVTHLVRFLLELPPKIARRCVFNCDTSDIFHVHKILGDHMCIAGNIPLSTMCVGTPHDVEKYCEKLFDVLKPGGGFILSPALGIPDDAKPENVHAMIRYAHTHGKYY